MWLDPWHFILVRPQCLTLTFRSHSLVEIKKKRDRYILPSDLYSTSKPSTRADVTTDTSATPGILKLALNSSNLFLRLNYWLLILIAFDCKLLIVPLQKLICPGNWLHIYLVFFCSQNFFSIGLFHHKPISTSHPSNLHQYPWILVSTFDTIIWSDLMVGLNMFIDCLNWSLLHLLAFIAEQNSWLSDSLMILASFIYDFKCHCQLAGHFLWVH